MSTAMARARATSPPLAAVWVSRRQVGVRRRDDKGGSPALSRVSGWRHFRGGDRRGHVSATVGVILVPRLVPGSQLCT